MKRSISDQGILLLLLCILLHGGSVAIYAALRIPYSVDPYTLHLWHLDEAGGNIAKDAVPNQPITLTNTGSSQSILGAPSFPGLGFANSGTPAAHMLSGGRFPDVSPFQDSETGAFTFEAIVRFDSDPRLAESGLVSANYYFSPDGTEKAWSWGISGGVMYFGMVGTPVDATPIPLPPTGPDAALAGAWYHVAVSSTGDKASEGTRTNLITLYWTRLDPFNTEAHKLAEFTSPFRLDGSPSRSVKPVLGIGGNLAGTIDEVRISRAALKPTEMAFGPADLPRSAASALFNTGIEENGAISRGNASDLHWSLFRSSDPTNLGPSAMVFENSRPLETSGSPGWLAGTNGLSMWIGPAGNRGGDIVLSPPGDYVYRTRFLMDEVNPAFVRMTGRLWASGASISLRLNGRSSEVTRGLGNTLSSSPFSLTNGFVVGWNTLDFIQTLQERDLAALRVEFESAGLMRSEGSPVIREEPVDESVREGAPAAGFSVVAFGRPPLSFQWFADGLPVLNATNRVLSLNLATARAGTNFSILIRNDSGSVTSRVATLRIVPTNQPPVPAPLDFVAFEHQPASVPLSQLVFSAIDRDGDPIRFLAAESSSSNGRLFAAANVKIVGAAIFYDPIPGVLGSDSFGYTISDGLDSVRGVVVFQTLRGPADQSIPLGATATLTVSSPEALSGYTFKWQFNGTNIGDATANSITISNARLADAGSYRVIVTNPAGESASSPPARLTVGSVDVDFGQPRILSDCSFSALESAIQAGGNYLLNCEGPILFPRAISIRTNVALTGAGLIAFTGNDASRFFIMEPGAHLILNNLTLRNGSVAALANTNGQDGFNAGTNVFGGAIWNRGGNLSLSNCLFLANSARGGDGGPGALSQVVHNTPGTGGSAFGGAIMSSNAVVHIESCVFRLNNARGGNEGPQEFGVPPGGGGNSTGGAIYHVGGDLTIQSTLFEANQAFPGKTVNSRYTMLIHARGGAVAIEGGARAEISTSRFATNVVSKESAAEGGAIYSHASDIQIETTDFVGNNCTAGLDHWQPVGNARADGGALCLTGVVATIDRCFFSGNSAIGGVVNIFPYSAGASHSYGGALFISGTNSLSNSTFSLNRCIGALGDLGSMVNQPGNGYGGGLYAAGVLTARNNTFTGNSARGGAVPTTFPNLRPPSPSLGLGGAFASAGAASLAHSTFASNSVESFGTNALYSPSAGGAIFNSGQLKLEKSILAFSSSNSVSGPITDAGENISSDGTPTFSAASSRNNIDPLLAPLRYNRGPTPTMALKPGSPAIDAATPSPLYPTDQRGEPRPFGIAADVGAYEVTATPVDNVLEAALDGLDLNLLLYGTPSQSYEILSSTNLLSWATFSTGAIDPLGRLRLQVPLSTQPKARLFKARQIGQ